jgi:DNA-binding response OmpR family regulator
MVNLNRKRERARILFVEDEEDAKNLAALTLTEYSLTYARDFAEGLLAARRGYFDLYILDNWLPDKSGVELCRAIREFDPHAPILFYSACGYPRDIREGIRAGAQAYLVKPVHLDELRRTVAQLISATRETAFEARIAELTAIREELAIRQTEIAEGIERAKEKRRRAEEKVLRDKAQLSFLAAGGNRGSFAREWLSMFLEDLRGVYTPAAASDN